MQRLVCENEGDAEPLTETPAPTGTRGAYEPPGGAGSRAGSACPAVYIPCGSLLGAGSCTHPVRIGQIDRPTIVGRCPGLRVGAGCNAATPALRSSSRPPWGSRGNLVHPHLRRYGRRPPPLGCPERGDTPDVTPGWGLGRADAGAAPLPSAAERSACGGSPSAGCRLLRRLALPAGGALVRLGAHAHPRAGAVLAPSSQRRTGQRRPGGRARRCPWRRRLALALKRRDARQRRSRLHGMPTPLRMALEQRPVLAARGPLARWCGAVVVLCGRGPLSEGRYAPSGPLWLRRAGPRKACGPQLCRHLPQGIGKV